MEVINRRSADAFEAERLVLDRKSEATLIALFALGGHAVHRLESGGFLVTWRNCARHCGDIESLRAFARQVGAIR